MLARIWGCRGSMAKPGRQTLRYGGNTSCVEVRTGNGALIVLDAGTGIAELGVAVAASLPPKIHLLLTHLHMDHIEGLGFFAPLWDPAAVIDVWGPPSPTMSLAERLSRYLSPPLFPVQLSDIPATVTFNDVPDDEFVIESVRVLAGRVEHPGPTVGYRLSENGHSFAYIPDHEPARVSRLESTSWDWLPGGPVAHGADVLLHDSQYTDDEYPDHVAWGHSSFGDALTYANACETPRVVLFHHDPSRTDTELDELGDRANDAKGEVVPVVAHEGMEIELPGGADGVTIRSSSR